MTGHIYTSHKTSSVINVLAIEATPTAESDPTLPDTPQLTLVETLVIPGSAVNDFARGLAVSPDGSRLYAAYRSPSSLLVFDVSPGAEGNLDTRLLTKIQASGSPTSWSCPQVRRTHESSSMSALQW